MRLLVFETGNSNNSHTPVALLSVQYQGTHHASRTGIGGLEAEEGGESGRTTHITGEI